MKLTRRRFLKYVALTASAGTAGAFVFLRRVDIRNVYRNMTKPVFEKDEVGQLNSQTLDVLLSATTALVDYDVEPNNYEIYFEWRSANLPGYKALYENFTAELEQLAQDKFGQAFVECQLSKRQSILNEFVPSGWLYHLRKSLSQKKHHIVYHRRIIQEILKLFSRTDAWTLLGYRYWPGQARGLEECRKSPSANALPMND
ncbi:twin-arginine translocation signal domain-containing protein [candidate division KSB1 bacterium]|nr:twin-arginine translocation signal domain-containing protein [candidate division KSB1 bacterium]NIR69173.1 twin-arginine translocation signal domain-containing protein [candidate division KSB1 bacterium]NIS25684.1 twin-arginine translocation signal domain-containing protein [candidate division KSB1 bacterium]NIT72552.1 twin-arginine translocation signal domain-containing protein [candidate division KSB1 bacterium]NIU26361.1 twin-arginine translocation signal domain-containing protein [candid